VPSFAMVARPMPHARESRKLACVIPTRLQVRLVVWLP
jgi:hypothetical protein